MAHLRMLLGLVIMSVFCMQAVPPEGAALMEAGLYGLSNEERITLAESCPALAYILAQPGNCDPQRLTVLVGMMRKTYYLYKTVQANNNETNRSLEQ